MFSRVFRLGLPDTRKFALGLTLAGLEAVAAIALLATSAWLISAAAEQPPIMYLNEAIVGVRGFALGRAFFRYTQRLVLHDSAFEMLSRVRPRLFSKVAPLAPAGLGKISSSDYATKMVQDTDELQNLSLRVIAPLIQGLGVTALSVIGLALISPANWAFLWLGLVALLASATAVLFSKLSGSAASKVLIETRADLNVATAEYLENLEMYQAYGWDHARLKMLAEHETKAIAAANRNALSAGVGASIFALLGTVAVVLTSFAGATGVANGQLDHRWLAVLALVPMAVFEFLVATQPAIIGWQRYRASAERITSALDLPIPAEVLPNLGDLELQSVDSIEFRDATIRYPYSSSVAVHRITFALKPGQITWLQGPSGAGKTSVAFAIAGFLKPAEGGVLLNGRDLSAYRESDIRARIGYLEQRPTIFDADARTNLRIGDPTATDETLWQVLEQVGLDQMLRSRDGLDTQLGDRGVAISGGEAQRFALARALLANFQVLILDEPTENLDQASADSLWQLVFQIARTKLNRIVVVISHGITPSQHIDQIVTVH